MVRHVQRRVDEEVVGAEEAPRLQETVSKPETPQEELITAPEPRKKSPLKYTGITMVSLGGVMLIAGTATWGLTVANSNQLSDNCPDKIQCDESHKSLKEKGEALKTATIGLLAAGAAVTTAGMIMTIFENRKNKMETETLSALPFSDGTMVGISVHRRF